MAATTQTERPESTVVHDGFGTFTVEAADAVLGSFRLNRPSGTFYRVFAADGTEIGVARLFEAAVAKIERHAFPPPPEPVQYDLSSLPAGWTLTVSINAETGAMQALLRNPLGEQVAVVSGPVGAGMVIS